MRKFYTLLLTILFSTVAFAQLEGNGYYRVKSEYTQRYLYVMDDRGEISVSTASADLGAIKPYSGEERMISDPATVVRIETISGGYNFLAQGTSTYSIIKYAVLLRERKGVYLCAAESHGLARYLADTQTLLKREQGTLQAISADEAVEDGHDLRNWIITPIKATSDNYFGVKPTFQANGKYYTSFYVDFPFSFASSGMKAYVVEKSNDKKAVLKEVTSSVIPAKTPVLLECSSANPSDNRLNIGGEGGSVSGNQLKGNFFCNDVLETSGHRNVLEVTAKMRVFGVTKDGKLGLVVPTGKYVPANCAYLNSDAEGLAEELTFVSEEEFNRVEVTGVSLDKTALTMEKGDKATLVATIAPANATDKTLSWKSSNETVATVTADGVVTAVAEGKATITVSTVNGLTATCEITVEDNSAVGGVFADDSSNDVKIYTIGGAYVGNSMEGLGKGIVIKNGKKVLLNK